MIAKSPSLTDVLKTLSDPTRLRILGLVAAEELSVGELARVLEMAQSRVSNHLRVLREAHLLDERHVGRTTHLRLTALAENPGAGESDITARIWHALQAEITTLPEYGPDRARLEVVISERARGSTEFFDRVAGEWDKIGVDFKNGQARQRAAAALLPHGLVLGDLGSGTGYMAQALVGLCTRLVCVDASQGMLAQAKKKLGVVPKHCTVEFRRGELDELPIEDGELDGCVAAMVLHHLPSVHAALAEMQRVLKVGGHAVVLELAPHKEEWMHAKLGDRHLGLASRDVMRAFEKAGFVDVQLEASEDRYEPRPESGAASAPSVSLPLYIVRARKPARA
ncbi:MAG: metalloregulator ArsR/SmtB family transcription factor [Planctomycetes bacterium]|nr:metalloregulator ArsR/SmtB family transcription factor [Planctomycetota bacterium]